MAWFILFVAGLFEIAWAVGLKYSEGFTKLWPSIATGISMALSIYLLSVALRVIPLGTGYAVWTGIGAVGTTILGILLFEESKDFFRIICILFIVIGILGLKFFAK